MDLMLFRTFQVVAETGSFTAAAERLCVSQSAVSRRIRQLEDHYNVDLLDRTQDPVTPTPAGTVVLQKSRRILDVENEMEEEVTRLALHKKINFCCTPCFGTGTLSQVFQHFVATHGMTCDLNINFLMPEEILSGLKKGSYQFAVVEHCDTVEFGPLEHFDLTPDTMLLVSAPAMSVDSETLSLDRLAAMTLFLKSPHGCGYRFLEASMATMGRSMEDFPNLTFYDDLHGLIRQVVAGAGIGFLSRTLITRELAEGLLRIHSVPGLEQVRKRTLVLAPGEKVDPLVRDFAAAICENLGVSVPGILLPTEA